MAELRPDMGKIDPCHHKGFTVPTTNSFRDGLQKRTRFFQIALSRVGRHRAHDGAAKNGDNRNGIPIQHVLQEDNLKFQGVFRLVNKIIVGND